MSFIISTENSRLNKEYDGTNVQILVDEKFTIEYKTDNKQTYYFNVFDSNGDIVFMQRERYDPYYLFGNNDETPYYKSFELGDYSLSIDNVGIVKFSIVKSLDPEPVPEPVPEPLYEIELQLNATQIENLKNQLNQIL